MSLLLAAPSEKPTCRPVGLGLILPPVPRCSSASTFANRRGAPELGRSSLALAALPVTRHCSDTSSSSSASASVSAGGYDSSDESELGGFTASFSSAVPTGFGDGDELCSEAGSGAGGLPHQRRALASIKTTRKLRVGVLEGTTFLNQVGAGWDAWVLAVTSRLAGHLNCGRPPHALALWPIATGWRWRCLRLWSAYCLLHMLSDAAPLAQAFVRTALAPSSTQQQLPFNLPGTLASGFQCQCNTAGCPSPPCCSTLSLTRWAAAALARSSCA